MRLVFVGLSLSSSWGNGHATTYRALLAGLGARGHEIVFLEREQPWYAAHRDLRDPAYCQLAFYDSPGELAQFASLLRNADAVILGSYVPDGVAVAEELLRILGSTGRDAAEIHGRTVAGIGRDAHRPLLCFYDIDTPVTLRKLAAADTEYLAPALIPQFDLYLSFTGGPTLRTLQDLYGAPCAEALYCSVDPERYHPVETPRRWALGYLGTYSPDRQPPLERLLLEPARRRPELRFVIAGSMYPDNIAWPDNVDRIDHLPPDEHAAFYSSLDWTLNVTRADMLRAGYSPSVRLFEATACATPVISDPWPGLDTLFQPGREIITAADGDTVLRALALPKTQRQRIAEAGRQRTLQQHTARHRAAELETYLHRAAACGAADARQGAVA